MIINDNDDDYYYSLRPHCKSKQAVKKETEGVVSKETVVLRRWGSNIQKFGFINGVDKCKLATVQRF